MTIIDENDISKPTRPPIPPGPDKAPPVLDKLNAARSQFEASEDEYRGAALAEALGEDGGADRLAAVKEQRARLEQRIAELEAAHAAALEVDEVKFRAQRAALHKTVIRGLRRNIAARAAAAERLGIAIENAALAWRDLYVASRKTAASAMALGGAPDPRPYTEDWLRRVVEHELYRVGGHHPLSPVKDGEAPTMPGGQPVNAIDLSPSKAPSLRDELRRADESFLATLESRQPD